MRRKNLRAKVSQVETTTNMRNRELDRWLEDAFMDKIRKDENAGVNADVLINFHGCHTTTVQQPSGEENMPLTPHRPKRRL